MRNKHNRMTQALMVLALCLGSAKAMAACSFMDGRFNAGNSETLNFGDVVVQRTAAVGSVVASITSSSLGSRNNFFTCDDNTFRTVWAEGTGGFTPVSYGGQTLYQSGIPGLAIRIVTPGAGSNAGRFGSGALPRGYTGSACAWSTTWWRLCGGTWGNVSLQLVKIAATTGSGPMTGGSIVKAQVVGESDIMNVILGGGTVRTVGCSVSNTTVNVPMGLTRNIDFSGPGSTGNDNTFDIALDCTAGTRVSMRLDPGSAGLADASNGVLNLNGGSGAQASGVGIQVLYNDAPVQFGTAMSVGTSRGGFTDLLLKARYYQTGSKVMPGQADATATFTMTYQ